MASEIEASPIKNFVCSFDMLPAIQSTNMKEICRLISKLEEDIRDTTKTDDETVNLNNFLTVLYFMNDDIDNSLKHCAISLSVDSNNLTAIANSYYIHSKTDEICKAEEKLEILTELRKKADFKETQLEAKAGLAYGYSRAGPTHHQKSVDLYEEVLRQKPNTPHWSFGLALTLQRQRHIFCAVGKSKYSKTGNIERAASLFYDVATGSSEDVWRGKSWVKLGHILYEKERDRGINLPQKIEGLKSKYCFVKAYELCPSEPFVLENCGKFYRYFNLLEKSEMVLRSAVYLHPTVFSYHHLALTLKRKVEIEVSKGRRSVPHMSTTESSGNPRKTYNKSYSSSESTDLDHVMRQLSFEDHGGDVRGKQREQRWSFCRQNSYRGRGQHRGLGHSRGNRGRFGQDHSTKMRSNCFSGRLVKSPEKVVKAPRHGLLSEALDLLQKAYDLSNQTAVFMLYEKALIYRMIGDNKEAISSLKRIALKSKKDIDERPEILVNVYEQQGYCLKEMIESGESKEPFNDRKEVLNFFSKAIELQAGILKSAPELKGAWSSFKTVQDLYEGGTAEDKKKLAHLHQLLDHHSECIRLYEEEDVNTSMTGRDYCRKARSHMAQDQYDEAISLLKIVQCTEQSNAIEEDLYRQAYFGGAVQAYKNQDIALAHTRFKEIYTKVQTSVSDVEGGQKDQEEYYYIQFIHYCTTKCEYAHSLSKLLQKYTGINLTVNTDSCMPGKMKLGGITEVMKSVPKIVILLHKGDRCHKQDYHIELAIEVNEKVQNKIAVMSEPGTEVPSVLNIQSIPNITCPTELDIVDTMTSEHEQLLKDVFAKVINVS